MCSYFIEEEIIYGCVILIRMVINSLRENLYSLILQQTLKLEQSNPEISQRGRNFHTYLFGQKNVSVLHGKYHFANHE